MSAVVHWLARRSRSEKWAMYAREFPPREGERIIDVGVSALDELATENYFLHSYPYEGNVTAVGVQSLDRLAASHTAVRFVQADGRDLSMFTDREFDVAHSNAVVEHVGTYEEQRKFVHEVCRVATAGFVTTPNRSFPVDTHTHVPLLHWLPRPLMLAGYRRVRRYDDGFWLLTRRRLVALFPPDVDVTVKRTRIAFLTATWVVVFRHRAKVT